MCGRLELDIDVGDLVRVLPWLKPYVGLKANHDLRPSQGMLALVGGADQLELLRWGLIPSWARDEKIAYKTINARAETVHELPSCRGAFKSKRAVIFASGFYEWRTEGKKKTPFLFELPNRQPMAIAGLWESWNNPSTGEVVRSGTLITTMPCPTVAAVHNRMPVILRPDQVKAWLGSGKDLAASQALMQPYAGKILVRDEATMLALSMAPVPQRSRRPRPTSSERWADMHALGVLIHSEIAALIEWHGIEAEDWCVGVTPTPSGVAVLDGKPEEIYAHWEASSEAAALETVRVWTDLGMRRAAGVSGRVVHLYLRDEHSQLADAA